jgi:hypothetical protein
MRGLPIAALGARPRLLLCLDLVEPAAASDMDATVTPFARNCGRVLAHARDTGWTVVHVHARAGCGGRAMAGLSILPSEPLFHRRDGSAFSSPEFEALAHANPSAELIIVGASPDSACLATALAAFERDMAVAVVDDAVSVSPQERLGLDGAMGGGAVRFVCADNLLGRARKFVVIEGGGELLAGRAP